MEHIAAFMILIACSDSLQDCSEQPAPAVGYETVQQCEAELSPAIRMVAASNTKALGKCIEIDPALFYEDAEIVWDVSPKGEIEVAIELINPEILLQDIARSDTPDQSTRLN